MKKFFQIIGVLTLFLVSFSYHDEVEKVVKLSDNLVKEIENNSSMYKQEKIEAIVTQNTIIPGINGKEVDINKSYKAMKQDGIFNENKLVYKTNEIKNKLKDNKNKYIISGNKEKKEVALIFQISFFDDTEMLIQNLRKYDAKATFFTDAVVVKENLNDIKTILSDNHTIGNLSEEDDYVWLKTLVTSVQKNNYCITEKENQKRLNYCSVRGDYTIMTNHVIKENPFIYLKNNLTNGVILYFDINDQLNKEVSSILKYIKGKGYKIVSLETLIQE